MSQISKKLNEVVKLHQQARALKESVRHAVLAYLEDLTGLVDNSNYSGKQAVGKAFAPEVLYSYNQDKDLIIITYHLIVNEFGDWGEEKFVSVHSQILDAYLQTTFSHDTAKDKSRKCFRLVCPKCSKEFEECESWPAYHNRVDFQCPHCGHIADSWDFRVPITDSKTPNN